MKSWAVFSKKDGGDGLAHDWIPITMPWWQSKCGQKMKYWDAKRLRSNSKLCPKCQEENMDRDGYPTAKTLQRLRTWPDKDVNGALDFLAECWGGHGYVSSELHGNEASVIDDDSEASYLRLATGGWSGNEDLIDALSENSIVWSLTWCLSGRGGLYIFKYLER